MKTGNKLYHNPEEVSAENRKNLDNVAVQTECLEFGSFFILFTTWYLSCYINTFFLTGQIKEGEIILR
jgi:hypothetical protein